LSVVEIEAGLVKATYPLVEELPHTEWLPGQIELRQDKDGACKAYYQGKQLV
jgi:hypothetical protein